MNDDFIFVTGNQHKADFLAKWLGFPVEHRKLDLDEIQSLDLREVVEHKARQAYEKAGRPVLVEDVSLTFTAMGRLPGTFIKWFLEEMGVEKLCELAKSLPTQKAVSSILYALYEGKTLKTFYGEVPGRISDSPRGDGWGFNLIFIPEGLEKTYAEMSDEEFGKFSHRGLALEKLKSYLKSSH